MDKRNVIEILRGIAISIEKLMSELQEDSTPVPQSRPFERGDRVKHNIEGYEADVLESYENLLAIRKDDGFFDSDVLKIDFTLVTPASERKIKVGDTFSCPLCKGREFTVHSIRDSICDSNGNYHDKVNCIFRSRPHVKPEPEKRADDIILEIKKVIKEWEAEHDRHE